MATYYEDWSLDSTNAAPNPSRWTPYGFAGTSGYWTGKVQDTGGGIRAVQPRDTGWGDTNVGYTRAELGTYTPGGSETIEIAIRFRFTSGQGSGGIKFGNYYAGPSGATTWAIGEQMPLVDYVAGTGSASYTVTSNTWWLARLQRTGAGVFKLKLWQDGTSEPESWLITSSADTTYTSGGLGFYAYAYPGNIDIRNVGIGTDGDSAPTGVDTTAPSAPGTPSTTRLTSTTASVSYTAASDDTAVVGYESSLDNSTWTDRGNNLSFTQTGLTPSTGATIYVRAYDAIPNYGSASSADIAAVPPPAITDVDTDEIITATQTEVAIVGTDLGANTSARTLKLVQGSTQVTQSQVSGNATSGTFDVVFDSGAGPHLKYGAATLRATVGAQTGDISVTITAPSGKGYVNVGTPNADTSVRLTTSADAASGDQVEISNVIGGAVSDVVVNTDLTWDADDAVSAFTFRLWSAADSVWGDPAVQDVLGYGPDTTPDVFVFTDVTGIAPGQVVTSDAITISGINTPTTISVSNGEYSVNLGSFTNSSGTVNNGDSIRARHTSSASYNTQVNTAITVGGMSDTFSSTTFADPGAPSGANPVTKKGKRFFNFFRF